MPSFNNLWHRTTNTFNTHCSSKSERRSIKSFESKINRTSIDDYNINQSNDNKSSIRMDSVVKPAPTHGESFSGLREQILANAVHAFPSVSGAYGECWKPAQIFEIVLRPFNGGFQALLTYGDRSDRRVAMTTDAQPTMEEALTSLLEETGEYAVKPLAWNSSPECGLHSVFKDGVKGWIISCWRGKKSESADIADMSRRGGLFGLVGQGVGVAAEYREHRKQQKLSRENSQQDQNATSGPSSSRPQASTRELSTSSDLAPPAYTDVAGERSDRTLASGKPASSDKKAAMAQYDDESDSSDDDLSIEDDEEAWQLDEALDRSDSRGLPSYEESEQEFLPVDDLVREVVVKNRTALSMAPGFERTALPCPVIIPQRRPRKKTRGFVRAYAPLLGECSGIDQETFLAFLHNFYKSSQASPVFTIIQVAAGIAGFAPSVIAMAVTTAVQIGARVGQEVQSRQRTNDFLDKMNEELFKPAGLYAMIVKYKSDAEVRDSGNSLLARFGVSGEKVDFNTNQTIAKYSRQLSDESATSGSGEGRGMSDRMKGLRLASGTTAGTHRLPEACPLIFPDIDKALASKEGPETFKDKTKDAKNFLTDYMDRRAQMQYARDDPNSTLKLPEEQRAFRSKLADPNHPMYNGGLVGFVSGGALSKDRLSRGGDYGRTPRQERRFDKDERRALKYEQRMAGGRDLSRKKQRRYDRILAEEEYYGGERRLGGRDIYGRGYGSGYDRYGDGSSYGGRGLQPGYGRGRGSGGPIGLVGSLIGAAINSRSGSNDGRSREYEDSYNRPSGNYGDDRAMRRSFDERSNAPAPPAPYGGEKSQSYGSSGHASYEGSGDYGSQSQAYGRRPDPRSQRRGGGGGGPLGMVKKIMKEDVLYLMIVNMPSEAELAEARELLARTKNGSR